jgi:hypothetical protein
MPISCIITVLYSITVVGATELGTGSSILCVIADDGGRNTNLGTEDKILSINNNLCVVLRQKGNIKHNQSGKLF